MLEKIFNRKSGSTDENENGISDSVNEPKTDPSVSSNQISSSPLSKKRNRSASNSDDEIKRQNVNDSFLLQLDNFPSDLDTSSHNKTTSSQIVPPVNSDTSGLEVPFDENTPYWVPILLQSFDALKSEIQSNVHALSVEVKSLNDKFEKFCTDTSNRIDSIESKAILCEEKVAKCENGIASIELVSETQTKIVQELEKSVSFLSQNYDSLKQEILGLTAKNTAIEKTAENLSLQLDSNEQHNRNQCLLLHGVPESDKETPAQCKTLFTQHVANKLNTDIHESYIVRAHRLGQRKTNGKPRPLIARISSFELRSHIFFNKKLFKGSSMSITENLTKRRMNEKAKAERVYGETNVWTREGRIYAKDPQSGVIKNIFS